MILVHFCVHSMVFFYRFIIYMIYVMYFPILRVIYILSVSYLCQFMKVCVGEVGCWGGGVRVCKGFEGDGCMIISCVILVPRFINVSL